MRKSMGAAALVASVFVTGCSAFQKGGVVPPGPMTGKLNASCTGPNSCDVVPVPVRANDGVHCFADASYNVNVSANLTVVWLLNPLSPGSFQFKPSVGVAIDGLQANPDFTNPGYGGGGTNTLQYQWTAARQSSGVEHSYTLNVQFRPNAQSAWTDCTAKDPTIVNEG